MSRRVMVAVAAASVLVAGSFAAGRVTAVPVRAVADGPGVGSDHGGRVGDHRSVRPATAEPAGAGEGSTAGARAAAVAYVVWGQELVGLAPTEAAERVRAQAAALTAEHQVADVLGRLAGLRDRLAGGSGRIRYLQAPLAARVEGFGAGRARVAVWSVGVLWRRGAAEPQAGWLTTTVELVWEQGGWKVWSESTVSGPTPFPNADLPVTGEDLDRLLAGFEPWPGDR